MEYLIYIIFSVFIITTLLLKNKIMLKYFIFKYNKNKSKIYNVNKFEEWNEKHIPVQTELIYKYINDVFKINKKNLYKIKNIENEIYIFYKKIKTNK
jgi:hypothetical protein